MDEIRCSIKNNCAISGLIVRHNSMGGNIEAKENVCNSGVIERGPQGIPGEPGKDGRGITNISKTSTAGLIDTYTITYTDSTTSNFNVTNGAKGDTGEAATIEVGTVTTVNYDQPATVTNVGTDEEAIFNFEIPRGVPGSSAGIEAGEAIDITDDTISVKYDNTTLKVNSSNQLYAAVTGNVDDVKVDGTSVVSNKIANIDLTSKQNITDNTLQTTAKTIVGAINEVNNKPSALANLTDVSLTSLADKQLLSYNTTTQKWENTNASASKYLLEHFWSDHLIDNMAVLRADTFSWQSGTTYSNAYNHLVDDIEDKTLTSETVAGITIQYYLADDGHKICPASQENNVLSLYNTTGIAWYYILDEENTRFKLPRTKKNKYQSIASVQGNGYGLVLTDGTQEYGIHGNCDNSASAWGKSSTNVGASVGSEPNRYTSAVNKIIGVSTNPTKSGIQANLETDTQMYLYFYVGEFAQTAIEQTAGITSEQLNAKVDTDSLEQIYPVIATYVNGNSGYRIWSDGYCEQWGKGENGTGTKTVTLVKNYSDTNYSILQQATGSGGYGSYYSAIVSVSASSFTVSIGSNFDNGFSWLTKGYLAEGEY